MVWFWLSTWSILAATRYIVFLRWEENFLREHSRAACVHRLQQRCSKQILSFILWYHGASIWTRAVKELAELGLFKIPRRAQSWLDLKMKRLKLDLNKLGHNSTLRCHNGFLLELGCVEMDFFHLLYPCDFSWEKRVAECETTRMERWETRSQVRREN